MRVTVFGSGGVGGYFGALLARAGHEVTFIARGAHLEAMRARGLQIKSVHGDFHLRPVHATDRPEEAPPADLVLYAVKTYHIPETVGVLPRLLAPEGVVLTTQNGVEAPDQVAAAVGTERTLAGAVWVVSQIEAPGVIRQESAFRRVVVGELDGRLTPALKRSPAPSRRRGRRRRPPRRSARCSGPSSSSSRPSAGWAAWCVCR